MLLSPAIWGVLSGLAIGLFWFLLGLAVRLENHPELFIILNALGGFILGAVIQHNRRMAGTDHLTQVYNRRYLARKTWRLLRFASAGRPLSLALADLDHFKAYNDTRGHQAGDNLLRVLAAELKRCVRGTDYVFRLGGDEFVIVFPNTLAEQAVCTVGRACERLRQGVLKGTGVTISAGVSTAPADGRTIESLLSQADKALYLAKKHPDSVIQIKALPLDLGPPLPSLPGSERAAGLGDR